MLAHVGLPVGGTQRVVATGGKVQRLPQSRDDPSERRLLDILDFLSVATWKRGKIPVAGGLLLIF
jgi:hypothetical protein